MTLPWKRSLAESTSTCGEESTIHQQMKQQVNFENGHQDTLTRYSNYTWGEAESTCSESRQVHPEIEDIKCTKHGADDKYTYKCTDLEDDLCDCKSTAEMMR